MITKLKEALIESVEKNQYDISQQLLEILQKCENNDVTKKVVTESVTALAEKNEDNSKCENHNYKRALIELFETPEFKGVELKSYRLYELIAEYFRNKWSNFPTEYENQTNSGNARNWVSRVSGLLNPPYGSNTLQKYFTKIDSRTYRFK